ncbi:glycosyltransferase family 4 protein [Pseudoalteromonas sp. NZS71_1]|uniref:glycosyltransferase family 4 protein n=1 Tax=Pseudoalteromonas sp. NZS71_1 TaxID=2792072 RepID=UPI0018CEA6E1|nr:glycosyltransferase family 4 protein [Pseudoalteromonas sp. NZS71_1]MBH0036786.1 glycosyltransferase family 4 protein [Pseudoalteromonas sp. NZS71_1]
MRVKIYFVTDNKSYLPEIIAYTDYLNSLCIAYQVVNSDFNFSELKEPYIKWVIMGINRGKDKNCYLIHEYLSLSTGRFAFLKNWIKILLSTKPDYQIFLNRYIKNVFYRKKTDYSLRDMGISTSFYPYKVKKEFDFVYCGSMGRNRNIRKMFELFERGILKDFTLLVIGDVPEEIKINFVGENINYLGRVDYKDVPKALCRAKCAINYIPDIYPFNLQTSTKLIEYLACHIPVISTKYSWVEEFSEKNNYPIKYIDSFLSSKEFESFINENHAFPDMSKYLWVNIIEQSQVITSVLNGFKEKFK